MVSQRAQKRDPSSHNGKGASISLQTILDKSEGTFAELLKKAKKLQKLQEVVLSCLPSPLREHCWVVNVKNGVLTLATDNAVWASRLSFLASDLLFLLQSEHHIYEIKSIHCKVAVWPTTPPASNQNPRKLTKLSAQNADHLRLQASWTADLKLKEVLQKLAEREKLV